MPNNTHEHAHNTWICVITDICSHDVELCRLRLERAAERRKQEAHAAWRQLLRSIWTRLRLHQDYGDNAAAHAGQSHAHHAVAEGLREDLSGRNTAGA